MSDKKVIIELKNIYKTYKLGQDSLNALDCVNLNIVEGEFVSVIGPSGSGKSTLMNVLGLLDNATSGEYYFDGKNIGEYKQRQLAEIRNKKIGFIFQGFNLLSRLSAYENVELPLIYKKVGAFERKKLVEESLKAVGLAERMKHKPSQLSGGQQQRVAIARALVTKPKIILADEPTGNLDSKSGADVIDILKTAHSLGTSIILITHDDAVAKCAQRIIKIFDGAIAEDFLTKGDE